jgi:hypothetical protein
MATPVDLVTAVSEAIKEVSGLLKELVAGAEVRRLKYRTEAAMQYVFVDEKAGDYEKITEKRQKDLKSHFRKRIFDEK